MTDSLVNITPIMPHAPGDMRKWCPEVVRGIERATVLSGLVDDMYLRTSRDERLTNHDYAFYIVI